jgi:hypothetical protein
MTSAPAHILKDRRDAESKQATDLTLTHALHCEYYLTAKFHHVVIADARGAAGLTHVLSLVFDLSGRVNRPDPEGSDKLNYYSGAVKV